MKVTGAVEFVISTDACREVGRTATAVAAQSGSLFFTLIDLRYGSGSFRVRDTLPNLIVEMEDGFGDEDWDDNVLAVHIGLGPCPPTGDRIFDHPNWREVATRLLQNAQRSKPLVDRQERAEKVFMNKQTGEIRFEPDPHPGSCDKVFVNNRGDIDVPPGDTLLGFAHSHVMFIGDWVGECNPGYNGRYDPDWFGGGSGQDWPFNQANQYEGWVVTPAAASGQVSPAAAPPSNCLPADDTSAHIINSLRDWVTTTDPNRVSFRDYYYRIPVVPPENITLVLDNTACTKASKAFAALVQDPTPGPVYVVKMVNSTSTCT